MALFLFKQTLARRPRNNKAGQEVIWEKQLDDAIITAEAHGASHFDILKTRFQFLSLTEAQSFFDVERSEGFPGLSLDEVIELKETFHLKG
ncbi:hypothetical protein HYT59_02025 [Candidatus Woesebacteria bacterium]|nr:hypothetical protein [Candidatus Woesebacteria bacterium]